MKRSEFEAERETYWSTTTVHLKTQVSRDVRAAEAAGVVWEPEEQELPERLAVNLLSGQIHDPVGGQVYGYFYENFRTHEGAEVVRRYNLVTVLKREMVEYYYPDHPTGTRWLALLDGKP